MACHDGPTPYFHRSYIEFNMTLPLRLKATRTKLVRYLLVLLISVLTLMQLIACDAKKDTSSKRTPATNERTLPKRYGLTSGDMPPANTSDFRALIYSGPWREFTMNRIDKPDVAITVTAPDKQGINGMGTLIGDFPYLTDINSTFKVETRFDGWADVTSPATHPQHPERFALGARVWKGSGRLYQAAIKPAVADQVLDEISAALEVERLWEAAGATLVTPEVEAKMLTTLPKEHWPTVCADEATQGLACRSLRTFALIASPNWNQYPIPQQGQVWMQVGIHRPSGEVRISAMAFGTLIAQRPLTAEQKQLMCTRKQVCAEWESPGRLYSREELLPLLSKGDTLTEAGVLSVGGTYFEVEEKRKPKVKGKSPPLGLFFDFRQGTATPTSSYQSSGEGPSAGYGVSGNVLDIDAPISKQFFICNRVIIPVPNPGEPPVKAWFSDPDRQGGYR
jgi:hypothetical protein